MLVATGLAAPGSLGLRAEAYEETPASNELLDSSDHYQWSDQPSRSRWSGTLEASFHEVTTLDDHSENRASYFMRLEVERGLITVSEIQVEITDHTGCTESRTAEDYEPVQAEINRWRDPGYYDIEIRAYVRDDVFLCHERDPHSDYVDYITTWNWGRDYIRGEGASGSIMGTGDCEDVHANTSRSTSGSCLQNPGRLDGSVSFSSVWRDPYGGPRRIENQGNFKVDLVLEDWEPIPLCGSIGDEALVYLQQVDVDPGTVVKPYKMAYGLLELDFQAVPPLADAHCRWETPEGSLPVLVDVGWDRNSYLQVGTSTTAAFVDVLRQHPTKPVCDWASVKDDCYLFGVPKDSDEYVVRWSNTGFLFETDCGELKALPGIRRVICSQQVLPRETAKTYYVRLSDLPVRSSAPAETILDIAENVIHRKLIGHLPAVTSVAHLQDPPAEVMLDVHDAGRVGYSTSTGPRADIPGSLYFSTDQGSSALIFNSSEEVLGEAVVTGDPYETYWAQFSFVRFENPEGVPVRVAEVSSEGTLDEDGQSLYCLPGTSPCDGAAWPRSHTTSSLEQACPSQNAPRGIFSDVSTTSTHARAIDCVAWWDIVSGVGGSQYAPHRSVSRAAMATFIANLIDETGGELPPGRDQGFADIDGNPHAQNINRLAEAGVIRGTADTTYAPNTPVNRAQMATFLVAAYEYRTDETLPTSRQWFDDTAGSHELNINKAAEAGFTSGTTARTYSPGRTVTRDAMASFVSRTANRLVDRNHAIPPDRR